LVRGTRREAESTLARLVSSTEGQGPVPAEVTVRQLLVAWLARCGDDLSPTTAREYRRMIETRIDAGLGDVVVRKLQPARVDRLSTALRIQAGLSPGTVRNVDAVLHRAFAQAVRWGWVQQNVISRTSPPRQIETEHTRPDPEQVAELIRTGLVDRPGLRPVPPPGRRHGRPPGRAVWVALDRCRLRGPLVGHPTLGHRRARP